jgi:dihydrofolate reductase
MIISIIVAVGQRGEIGKDNALLWKLPNDMRWFVKNTKGKPIVMGRKTFESFGAKPLPNRKNIVITRDENYSAEGAVVVHNIDDAIAAAEPADEVMIIGGAEFYKQLLPRAQRLYLTRVEGSFDADAFFPMIPEYEWKETFCEEHDRDDEHEFEYVFRILERTKH